MILEYNNEKEYRNYPAVSQSELSDLDYSPISYRKKKEEQTRGENPAFVFGSAVDCLLTRPKLFWSEFVVLSGVPPSENIKAICDAVFERIETSGEIAIDDLGNYEDDILIMAASIGYGLKWKDETVISKVKKEGGEDYFKALITSIGKQKLSGNDYQSAKNCVEALKTNQFTKEYFEKKDGVEIMYQVALLFKAEDVNCKALLDILFIDHINRKVRVVDIKTTGTSVYAFKSSYMKYRYYLQGAYYTRAVHEHLKDEGIEQDYELLSPLFLVAEKANVNPPFVYEMSWADVNVAINGGLYRDKRIKGYKELLRDLKWHEENQLWEYPKQVYLDNGIIQLNELTSHKDLKMI